MIYFDNAATGGRKPHSVLSAACEAIRSANANPGRSGHTLSVTLAENLLNCRSFLSDFFGGYGYERTVFTKNCTEALNIAIFGLANAAPAGKAPHIITTVMEHNSVLRPLKALERTGRARLTILRLNGKGTVSAEAFAAAVQSDTRAAVFTLASNVTGAAIDPAAVRAADAALVVLDAIDGPQVGTARAWKMSKQRGIPRFGLINRLDKDRADFRGTLEEMRKNHGKNVIIPLYWPVGEGANFSRVVNVLFDKEIPAEIADDVAECRGLWLDAIAETDDDLMMRYLDGEELSDEEIRTGLRKSIKTGRTIPVFAGSSVKDIGITELMDAIVELFPTPLNYVTVDGAKRKIADDTDAIGVVFKSINDPFVGQLTFVRTVSGVFRADSDIYNLARPGGKERFGTLFFMNGKSQVNTTEAGPGSIFAIAKLKDTHIGDTVSNSQGEHVLPGIVFPEPVMSYAVSAAKSGEDEKITAGLHKIIECIPTVRLGRDDETHELLLSGMGDQQLAIVSKRLKDQFKVEAVLSTPKIPYRETITANGEGHYRHKKQTGGAGQFAEVYLRISPAPEYEFVNEVVGGTIPKNFIPAVEKGVAEMMDRGPLVGCHVEGVRVAVYDGKYHPVDSNEMAFNAFSAWIWKRAWRWFRRKFRSRRCTSTPPNCAV